MRTVLLTGASGFVGSHIAEVLLSAGVRLDIAVRRIDARISALERRGAHAIFYRGPGDVSSLAQTIKRAEAVIHCAGAIRTVHPRDFFRVNCGLTGQLLQHMGRGQTMVFISSQAAAGPSVGIQMVDESTPPMPVNNYGLSKLVGEQMVRQWSNAGGGSFTILRPCAVYGPREKDFFNLFKAIRRGVCLLPGGGRQRFSIIHARDLAEAVRLALEKPAAGKTYFVCGDEVCTWQSLGEHIASIMRPPFLIRLPLPVLLATAVAFFADAVSRLSSRALLVSRDKAVEMKPVAWMCSNRRIKKDLGWQPKVALAAGLRDTARWYVDNGWLRPPRGSGMDQRN